MRLLNSERISRSVYEEVDKRLKEDITILEDRWMKMIGKAKKELEELENTIRFLETHLAEVELSYAVEEIDEETYNQKSSALISGLDMLKEEAEEMRSLLGGVIPKREMITLSREEAEKILSEVPVKRAFYFYVDYGQYTGKFARSLEDFAAKVKEVESISLSFHLTRGDFQLWIRDLGDPELAYKLNKLKKLELSYEELRERIYLQVTERIKELKKIIETA